jgi:hypothetical protein
MAGEKKIKQSDQNEIIRWVSAFFFFEIIRDKLKENYKRKKTHQRSL